MSFQEYSEAGISKLHLGKLNKKALAGVFAVALAVVCSIAYMLITFGAASSDADAAVRIEDSQGGEDRGAEVDSNGRSQAVSKILVHVAGCVKAPGVYELDSGARADDAVKAAGGFSKSADKTALNLATRLEDGQQIIVQEKGVNAGSVSGVNGANSESGNASSMSAGSSVGSDGASGKVNINTASASELQTLSGIGEAKAKKIIDYREVSGPFKSLDDLLNVSGIGEKTLESLRSSICV